MICKELRKKRERRKLSNANHNYFFIAYGFKWLALPLFTMVLAILIATQQEKKRRRKKYETRKHSLKSTTISREKEHEIIMK